MCIAFKIIRPPPLPQIYELMSFFVTKSIINKTITVQLNSKLQVYNTSLFTSNLTTVTEITCTSKFILVSITCYKIDQQMKHYQTTKFHKTEFRIKHILKEIVQTYIIIVIDFDNIKNVNSPSLTSLVILKFNIIL